MDSEFLILFDPAVDMPPREDQEIKDEAWDLAREFAVMSDFDVMSDEFVQSYQRMESILLSAEKYRAHLFLLSLHTVRHLLRTDRIHLSHPMEDCTISEHVEYTRTAIHESAEAIVEMLVQILFFNDKKLPVVSYEQLQEMPDFLRMVAFNFDTEEELDD
jgi:hypothetical protein